MLQQLAEEERSSARIFKFVADPPTTTLQRLKVCLLNNFFKIRVNCDI